MEAVLNGQQQDASWQYLQIHAQSIKPRSIPAVCTMRQDHIVILGGCDNGGELGDGMVVEPSIQKVSRVLDEDN